MTTHAGKILGKKLATLVGAATISLIGLCSSGQAQTITGFGTSNVTTPGYHYPDPGGTATNGQWTVSSGGYGYSPSISGNGSSLIVPNNNYATGVAYNNTQQDVSQGFTASFTFNAPANSAQLGGFAFVIQNDSRGLNAVGNNWNAMGWGTSGQAAGTSQVQNSLAVGFYIDSSDQPGHANYIGFSTTTNTNVSMPGSGGTFVNSGLTLDSGADINAVLNYTPGSGLTLALNGGTPLGLAGNSFDPTAWLGQNDGYVGFTTGNAGATPVTITNFSFNAVPEPATFAMLLGGMGMLTLMRRRR